MKKASALLLAGMVCVIPACLYGSPNQVENQPSVAATENKDTPAQQISNRPKVGRAYLEGGILLAASTVDYWLTYSKFKEDWQFRFSWKDQRRRFFSAESPKMDSNSFWFNWSHTLSGAVNYNFGRTNGMNSRASFLYGLSMSVLWECFSEYREVISINDIIFNSFGGLAIGESLFQVSSYFSHRKGFLNRLVGIFFDPVLTFNNWLDRKNGRAANSDSNPAWHRFCVLIGARSGSVSPAGTNYNHFTLGLETETNSAPGYGEPVSFRRGSSDTIFSRMNMYFDLSSAGVEESNITTEAVLFGATWQNVSNSGDGRLRGSSGFLGIGSGFDFFKKRAKAWYDSSAEVPEGGPSLSDARFWRPTPTEFSDKMAVVSLLGPILQISWFGPRLQVRWKAEAFGDFALVNALAYNLYSRDHDNAGVKTTLLNWGYYYAWGITLASDMAVDWRQWQMKGSIRCQRAHSIQGQDRYQFQGVVTDDFRIHDSRLVWNLTLGYRFPGSPIGLALTAESVDRRGRILDIRERYLETRFYSRLLLFF